MEVKAIFSLEPSIAWEKNFVCEMGIQKGTSSDESGSENTTRTIRKGTAKKWSPCEAFSQKGSSTIEEWPIKRSCLPSTWQLSG